LDEIKKMAADWEEAPPLYLQLDIHVYFLPLFIVAVKNNYQVHAYHVSHHWLSLFLSHYSMMITFVAILYKR
jgi:YLP motif-containing protein 1